MARHHDGRIRMKTLRSIALLLILPMIGCQPITGKTTGQNIDDLSITTRVKSKLVAERASNLTRVDVDTDRGTVYLIGSVSSEDAKGKAEQLAKSVNGVTDVVNELRATQP